MTPLEAMDVGKEAIWVMLKVSVPVMMVALIVGFIISLIQALTQIQEATLSFVPKIVATSLMLVFLMPFITTTLVDFTEELADKIRHIEDSDSESPVG
jgi:flagellar biosynthetic protein FliQ